MTLWTPLQLCAFITSFLQRASAGLPQTSEGMFVGYRSVKLQAHCSTASIFWQGLLSTYTQRVGTQAVISMLQGLT